jgi:hypothetical protein
MIMEPVLIVLYDVASWSRRQWLRGRGELREMRRLMDERRPSERPTT